MLNECRKLTQKKTITAFLWSCICIFFKTEQESQRSTSCYWTMSAFLLYFFCFGLRHWICVSWVGNMWSVTRENIWISRHCISRFSISSGSVWFYIHFWYVHHVCDPSSLSLSCICTHLHYGNLFIAANNADLLFADCSHQTYAEKKVLE